MSRPHIATLMKGEDIRHGDGEEDAETAHPRSTRRNEAEAAANHAVNWGAGLISFKGEAREINHTSTERSQACTGCA